jgi:hypothetical protein
VLSPCAINLGESGEVSANLTSIWLLCLRWSHLAMNLMAIYSRGGPAITSRSRIVSQAHGDHVGRRYSEGDYGMSATAAELTGLGGRR